MMKPERVFDTLFAIARDVEPFARAKLASCIVYKNDIISIGINRKKTHPFQAKFGKNEDSVFLHAETDAILNAIKNFDIELFPKCSLYVCRVKRHNGKWTFGMSKPCIGCTRAISTFNISTVFYSNDLEGFSSL